MLYGARHPGHATGLVLQTTNTRFEPTRVVEEFRQVGGDAIAEVVECVYSNDPFVTKDERTRCWALFGPWVPGDEEMERTVVNLELNASTGTSCLHSFRRCGDVQRAQSSPVKQHYPRQD
jgi:hypothetical protein